MGILKKHLIPLLVLLLGPLATSAQAVVKEEQTRNALEQSAVRINGKDKPEQIPYGLRMFTFFQRFKSGEITKELGLSTDDFEVLSRFTSRQAEADRLLQADHNRRWLKIADVAESMNADELASQMMAVRATTEAMQTKRYQAILAKLSAAGRASVNRYVSEKVRPALVSEDETVMAHLAPDFYKEQIIGTREYVRSGNWPAPPQVPEPSKTNNSNAATLTSPPVAGIGHSHN